MEDGRKDPVKPSMTGHISDGETTPEIRCRPSSMTNANICDGNKRSHPARMKAVIKHILGGRRLGRTRASISNIHVPTSCTSRVVCDYAALGVHSSGHRSDSHTCKHTITIKQSPTAQLSYRSIHLHHHNQRKVYIRRASHPPKILSSPSKVLNAFLFEYLRDSTGNTMASCVYTAQLHLQRYLRLLPIGFNLSIIPVCPPLLGRAKD